MHPIGAGAAERRDLVRADGVERDAAGARALPRDGRRARAEDQVARMQLDDDPPLALRGRDLDRVGVVRAAAALRPGRPPLGCARDRERHRRSEHGARARGRATGGAPCRRLPVSEPSSTTSVSKLPSSRATASSTATPRTSGTEARGGPLETTMPIGPGRRRLVAAGDVARDDAALGDLPRLLGAHATANPVRRSAAVASSCDAPSTSGTTATAVPRLTRTTRSRSARSTGSAARATARSRARPATDSEYERPPTTSGASAASTCAASASAARACWHGHPGDPRHLDDAIGVRDRGADEGERGRRRRSRPRRAPSAGRGDACGPRWRVGGSSTPSSSGSAKTAVGRSAASTVSATASAIAGAAAPSSSSTSIAVGRSAGSGASRASTSAAASRRSVRRAREREAAPPRARGEARRPAGRRPRTAFAPTAARRAGSRARTCRWRCRCRAPRACSGDQYSGVPSSMPWVVTLVDERASRASPKSETTTRPVALSIRTLPGVRSRWTIPRACA